MELVGYDKMLVLRYYL